MNEPVWFGIRRAYAIFRYDCQQDTATQLTDDTGKVWTVEGDADWVDPATCGSFDPDNLQAVLVGAIVELTWDASF